MKIDRTMLMLSSFAATISVVFAATMILSEGHADLNEYGEGWFEVALAGVVAILGYSKALRLSLSEKRVD